MDASGANPILALTLLACLVLGPLLLIYSCCSCLSMVRRRGPAPDERPPFTAARVRERINDHQRVIDSLQKLHTSLQRDEADINERARSSR